MKINNKHITFIETWLANGNNATEAYLTAYPNVNRETACANGARLIAHANIKPIIAEKKKELATKCMITKEEILADLKYIKDLHKDNPRSSNSIKAISEINKMLGFYMPTESNVNMNIEQPLFGLNDND